MLYQIFYHPEIKNDVAKFPQNVKDRIQRAIEERLLVHPTHFGIPLRRSLQGYHKMRVGDYRIIFKMGHDNIIVLMIGHRKDVYRLIPKRGGP